MDARRRGPLPLRKVQRRGNYRALGTPCHVNGEVFYNRRAGFLTRYIDVQYIAIYKNITAHPEDLPCPTWFVIPYNSCYKAFLVLTRITRGDMYALKNNVRQ